MRGFLTPVEGNMKKKSRACWTILGDWAGTAGSQVAELAVALPLLMIIVVGITDFGSAFNLKQILNSAAREGGRFASNQTMADVTNTTPNSVAAIRDVIDNYLTAANLGDCGLATAVPNKSGPLIWTYTATSGCTGNGTLTLIIDRGTTLPTTGKNPVTIESTHIYISYPFQWRFGKLMSLIVPNTSYALGVTPITADAIMSNLE